MQITIALMCIMGVDGIFSFKSKMFLSLHFDFSRVWAVGLYNLGHASGFCSDICKASGSLPPGNKRGAFPYGDLSALFNHVCVCIALLCLFFASLKSLLPLGSQALPQMPYAPLGLRGRIQKSPSHLSGIESISVRHSLLCLPDSYCVFCSCFVLSKNANDSVQR